MKKVLIGIDWGGTFLKTGVFSLDGKLLKKDRFSSDRFKESRYFLDCIVNFVEGVSKKYAVQSIGIGCPGIVNPQKGLIYYLPNIPGWKNYNLKQNLFYRLRKPLYIENDAKVAALAEYRCRHSDAGKTVIYLTLGTGVGGAVFIAGKLLQSQCSTAELGHVPLHIHGKKCSCGGRGCVETFLGNTHLVQEYRKLKKITQLVTPEDIYLAAKKKDAAALKVWKNFGTTLGVYCAGLVNIFNPELIIIGGGLTGAWEFFYPSVISALYKQAMWPYLKSLRVEKVHFKEDAGIYGAAELAKGIV